MAFQAVPETLEVNIRYVLAGGVPAENTLHYRKAAYDQDDADALSLAVDSWVGSSWLGFLNGNTLYNNTYVKGLESIIDVESINGTETAFGSGADAGLTNETSYAITLRSGFTGRSARGRIFMPPPPLAYLTDNNHVASAFPVAIAAALYTLDAILALEGFTPVIVSRYTAGAKRTTAVTLDVVSYNYSDLTLDSQRGRKPD